MASRIFVALAYAFGTATSTLAAEPTKQTAITISRETTYITEPLDAEGYPDYLAALNAIASEGVTPENNAAVDLAKILGPGEIPADQREQFFKLLGIEPLPAEGKYFVPLLEFLRRRGVENAEETEKRLLKLYDRPWREQEEPLLTEWLHVNGPFLDAMAAASKKQKYYSPLLRSADYPATLADITLPRGRTVTDALTLRASLSLGEREWHHAFRDLDACHRWALLQGQTPCLVGGLLEIAISSRAMAVERVLSLCSSLPATQLRDRRRFLATLPRPSIAARRLTAERFDVLNVVTHCRRFGLIELLKVYLPETRPTRTAGREIAMFAAWCAVDWDQCLQSCNRFHDSMVQALAIEEVAERLNRLDEIEREMMERRVESSVNGFLGLGVARNTITERTARAIAFLVGPACTAFAKANERVSVKHDLTQITFALSAYRSDHDAYPESLDDLAPTYLERVPKDRYFDADFHYKPVDDGFLLYSAGLNGEDEEGRGHDDSPEGDDLTVRSLEPERRALQQAR